MHVFQLLMIIHHLLAYEIIMSSLLSGSEYVGARGILSLLGESACLKCDFIYEKQLNIMLLLISLAEISNGIEDLNK